MEYIIILSGQFLGFVLGCSGPSSYSYGSASSFSGQEINFAGPILAPPASTTALHHIDVTTACYGSDPMQFPTTDYFAAAGEDIWDRGAACGRQYLVQCLSGPLTQGCVSNQTIQVKIVDRAQTSVSRPAVAGATLILSHTAFMAIANPAVHVVNSQYQQDYKLSG
ncbi:hypothetical protein OROMI_031254 [Orobanche minor]